MPQRSPIDAAEPIFDPLEIRLRALLPEQYQDTYDAVEPTSMGSAGLQYDSAGQVAWDRIWGSFCDLAMAGGPPHRGTLLEPGDPALEPAAYDAVTKEICRGIGMVTGLSAEPGGTGWVRVETQTPAMAGWLTRAIAMENISVRLDGTALELPVGPTYRVEREIKNVITAIAKTCHYWRDHMRPINRWVIGELLEKMEAEQPLIQPGASPAPGMSGDIPTHRYAGWTGRECFTVRNAIWWMRMAVASNMLARREGTVLFVPSDPGVTERLAGIHTLALARGVQREQATAEAEILASPE